MLARGLLELRPAASARISRRRAMPRYACSPRTGARSTPKQYAHVRRELRLEPDPAGDARDEA
jgi:hypothetical protein